MRLTTAILAAALALPAYAAPIPPMEGDYQIRGADVAQLFGRAFRGQVGKQPGEIVAPPERAGFGQNPRVGFFHSKDREGVRIRPYSISAGPGFERRDSIGGFRISLIDIGDQGPTSNVWVILTAERNGKRYRPTGGSVAIQGGANRTWNSNLTVLSYTGFLLRPMIEIWTEQGKIGEGTISAEGAPGFGDGFLFQIAVLRDCPEYETNAMAVQRWVKTADGYARVPALDMRVVPVRGRR